MTQSLEEYVAQATQAYRPASNAIQSQLDALDSRLATTNEQINRNYTQQQADLNRSRNMAAESASMQAAGSGGSFGGSANLANRRYYDKTFVPAVTQMKTNQANDLATARQNIEDTRNNLNSQMANIEAQANQQALAQYYADQEAERNRAAQIAAAAAANPYQYITGDSNGSGNQINLSSERNMYGGFDWTDNSGKKYTAAQVANMAGGDFNESLYNALSLAANQGDYYSKLVADALRSGRRYEANTTGQATGNSVWDTLGIRAVDNKKTYLNNGLSY